MSKKEILEYRGHKGTVEFSKADNCYFGQVLNLDKALVSYEGATLEELEKDFKIALDSHLEEEDLVDLRNIKNKFDEKEWNWEDDDPQAKYVTKRHKGKKKRPYCLRLIRLYLKSFGALFVPMHTRN